MKINSTRQKMLSASLLIPIIVMSMMTIRTNNPQAESLELLATSGNIFMQIDGLKGSSTSDYAKESHPLISVAFAGFRQIGSASSGSARQSSAPSISEIAVVKEADTASPAIFENMAKGTHFKEAIISWYTTDEKPSEYIKIELTDVIISSYVFSGSDGDVPLESFTLNFTKISYAYTDPSSGDSTSGGWDVVNQQPP